MKEKQNLRSKTKQWKGKLRRTCLELRTTKKTDSWSSYKKKEQNACRSVVETMYLWEENFLRSEIRKKILTHRNLLTRSQVCILFLSDRRKICSTDKLIRSGIFIKRTPSVQKISVHLIEMSAFIETLFLVDFTLAYANLFQNQTSIL